MRVREYNFNETCLHKLIAGLPTKTRQFDAWWWEIFRYKTFNDSITAVVFEGSETLQNIFSAQKGWIWVYYWHVADTLRINSINKLAISLFTRLVKLLYYHQ